MARRLTFAAPPRMSIRTETGWGSVPWTLAAVTAARGAGCWFIKSRHDFADKPAAIAAGVSEAAA